MKTINLPGGKTSAAATASAPIQTRKQAASTDSGSPFAEPAQASASPSRPLVMEMKDRPGVEADYDSDPTKVKLVFTVEKETSAKNIDLDVAEKELKLESEK